MCERIVPGFPRQIQGVREAIAQIAFNREGPIERRLGVICNLSGKLRNARVQLTGKLEVCRRDIAGVFPWRGAELRYIQRWQQRKSRVPDARVVMKGIRQRIRGIPEKITATNYSERVAAFPCEISPELGDFARNENSICGQWFQVNGINHS